MGFVNEYVEVPVGVCTDKHYESLGYEIPKRIDKRGRLKTKVGNTIKVKFEDILDGSTQPIDYYCDYCSKLIVISKYTYNKCNHDGKYYCRSCSSKLFNSGENNPLWDSMKTDEERQADRSYPEYIDFIKKVRMRDNYICYCCGKHGDIVHHLNGYNWYIEGRTDMKNSVTLCENCHMNFHSIYGNGNNTKEQFEEWLGEKIKPFKELGIDILPSRLIYNLSDDKIYTAKELYEKYGSKTYPYKSCNGNAIQFYGNILIWYDEYLEMNQNEIEAYILMKSKNTNNIPCIALETKEIFESYSEAEKRYNLSHSRVSSACDHTNVIKTAGKLDNGTQIHWMKYEDYLNASEKEIDDIMYSDNHRSISCILLNTGEIFQKLVFASNKYNINSRSISCACNNRNYAGLINNQPAKWIYYSTFSQMSEEEKQHIYETYGESFIEGSFLFEKMKKGGNR